MPFQLQNESDQGYNSQFYSTEKGSITFLESESYFRMYFLGLLLFNSKCNGFSKKKFHLRSIVLKILLIIMSYKKKNEEFSQTSSVTPNI